MGLEDIIKDDNKTSSQNKAKTIISLRRHLHKKLKIEYLTIKDPLFLWQNFKERYDHQRTVILSKACYD
jgi:S-adenosylmethionine:diacylglycerol 3-amino-3-carboxypropyl transferase